MAEELHIPTNVSRSAVYESLLPQIEALITGEPNVTANLANVCAALKEAFGFLWVGFYRVDGEELVLGPFQGPIACTRISKGKGVCGACWEKAETLVVPDVDAFPGHIACSSSSRSEIVVPGSNNSGEVALVLDIDSAELNDFSDVDKIHLEKLMRMLETSMAF